MRFIRKLALGLFVLLLVWVGLAESKWLPLTTDIQRKAIALMDASPVTATGKHNAFPTLWLAQYDIPAADLDKVMAADVARYRAPNVFDENHADFVSSAEGHYRKLELPPPGNTLLCKLNDEDCLAKVRGNTDAVRKYLGDYSLSIEHARALDDSDYYRDLFPPSASSPIPEGLSLGALRIADAALRFADGDKTEGLVRACSAATTWRRLATHSDNLIVQMVAIGNFHAAADLFADMLAEMPASTALPDACTAAFTPVAEPELQMCDTMKREHRVGKATLDQMGAARAAHLYAPEDSRIPDLFSGLLYNTRATEALSAVELAAECTSDPEIAAAAAHINSAPWWSIGGWQGALFNPLGGIVVQYSLPAYAQYRVRMHDMQRMVVLVRTALAMRDNAANAKGDATVAPDPGALPSGVTFDQKDHLLHIQRAYVRPDQNADFTIPLPASRVHGD